MSRNFTQQDNSNSNLAGISSSNGSSNSQNQNNNNCGVNINSNVLSNNRNNINNNNKDKRFSIHDAFEEETDEAIRVYGSTVISTPIRAKTRSTDDVTIRVHDPRTMKYPDDTTSRDSDSLIQEYGNLSTNDNNTYCWRHPKVRENWRTVLAAVTLLIVGTGLVIMGAYAVAEPNNSSQGVVFFVAGFICFIPGAYHVVYIWLAARGYRGFDFYHLPLFT